MSLLAVLVASDEHALGEVARTLNNAGSLSSLHSDRKPAHSLESDKVDLIVILCSDARGVQSRLPRDLYGIPILALESDKFKDGALGQLGAVFIHCPQDGAAPPEVLLHMSRREGDSPKNAEEATPVDNGLVDGHRLIGDSEIVREIKSSIQKVAATDSNVLITGETGTGKELIADLIQKNSRRCQRGYVCINCAAIPDSLLESELFGYERGAFTGAQGAGAGKLEGVKGGTVFFDEIGEMSLCAQAKILRLIETREIQRLGSRKPSRLDFRVIAATNLDVDAPASSDRFRRDLYFRLNVARIHMPALRERKSDIPLLIRHFIQHFNLEFGRCVERVAEDAMREFLHYEWPGNVRELKNTMEALFVNLPTAGETLLNLPARLRQHMTSTAGLPPSEQERLVSALWATDWNKSKAARQLHWSRMTLYRKMVKYGLDVRKEQSAAAGSVSG